MTNSPSALEQRAVIVTAAIRAAYAWSVRSTEPRAFEEVARMAGVVMHQFAPGQGPNTPMDLVAALQQPLGRLLPGLPEATEDSYGSEIDGSVLLTASGALSEDVYDVGCDYVKDLVATRDPGRDWLPSWSWMRANQVESAVFAQLIETTSEEEYRTARRFIVEFPAGDKQDLVEAANDRGARRVAEYTPIPTEQSYATPRGRWWWPCPVCRWPMHLDGEYVRCRYRPHGANYQLKAHGPHGQAPALIPVNVAGASQIPKRSEVASIPEARPADGAVRVEFPVWRYITVPGAAELRMFQHLVDLGAEVTLYPGYDRYDLGVTAGHLSITVDVKEHASTEALVRHLREKPPPASHIVLPDAHEGQVHAVRGEMSRYTVWTETRLYAQARSALRGVRHDPSC